MVILESDDEEGFSVKEEKKVSVNVCMPFLRSVLRQNMAYVQLWVCCFVVIVILKRR